MFANSTRGIVLPEPAISLLPICPVHGAEAALDVMPPLPLVHCARRVGHRAPSVLLIILPTPGIRLGTRSIHGQRSLAVPLPVLELTCRLRGLCLTDQRLVSATYTRRVRPCSEVRKQEDCQKGTRRENGQYLRTLAHPPELLVCRCHDAVRSPGHRSSAWCCTKRLLGP